MESRDLSWSITVGHGVRGGEWEKSGFIEAKRHRVSWNMSMTIMTNSEAKQREREKQSQELQDRLVVKLEDEEKRTFDKGEEDVPGAARAFEPRINAGTYLHLTL